MKTKLRKFMQQIASYVEIVLAAFLLIVIIFLAGKFIAESVCGIGYENATLEYFLEQVMTLAIGVEFVKMLCTHTPGTVIEVLIFAISRQMIAGHVSGFEAFAGVAAIAGLFATHKYLYSRTFGDEDKEEKEDKQEEKEV
ncbi:MAG: hypothetical protein Q4E78_05720 [Eubacteriales bacterium]|nr:hypothetical protein [Eubacteriales bacterium]